ncbi:RsmB/NOP family class I SAM-dependent RNA methyltransferase [Microlunatus parietis]|uniref:16S rRNA (Cytosine967-C5)-methyltransferase n=1 Tax=Microlunatus parietis TaxID=682979 RepID=A0A7Y9I2J2_9ACTN|nr:transcription antitermination factor NusB [Microlunatus parietis]NYE69054.1 16S rRNA (cytosine967-C5)-methyltransferase [Microlunatus parietis]
MAGGRPSKPPRDPARRAAFDALLAVETEGAYANLIMNRLFAERALDQRDAAFATELVAGTSRLAGTYDLILASASGRDLDRLDRPVLVLLRLGAHQLLSMRVPRHAAVGTTVELAREVAGPKITGLVNAVLRKVAVDTYAGWTNWLGRDLSPREALAVRTAHPPWIVDAYAEVLDEDELEPALLANNDPAAVTLAVRPGLADLSELLDAGAGPGRWSPFAATWHGSPSDLAAVRQGRAGVQDEGSQLVAAALGQWSPTRTELVETRPEPVEGPGPILPRPSTGSEDVSGPWLDLCAGPGGKSALLAGLAKAVGARLLAVELSRHRADLVRSAVRAFDSVDVIVADGTTPPWPNGRFERVLADVPCTGLGSLRRRPESRWRRDPAALDQLVPLQRALLGSALDAARPGGLVGYVTCSPHRRETVEVVEAVLAQRRGVTVVDAATVLSGAGLPVLPDSAVGPYLQLWPHRHQTDAMFAAYLRVG